MEWLRWAVRTPSRLVVLVVIAASVINAAMAGGQGATFEGFAAVVNMAGGVCILVVVVWWRWFWCGPAVQRQRAQAEALEAPQAAAHAQERYAVERQERLRQAKEAAERQRPEG